MEIYKDNSSSMVRWAAVALMAIVFVVLCILAAKGQLGAIDNPVLHLFVGARTAGATVFWKLITLLADTWVLAVFCACLIAFTAPRFKVGIPAAAMTLAAAIIHMILKVVINRARPDQIFWLVGANDPSFPSGHANASMVFYLFLMTMVRRRLIINGHKNLALAANVAFPAIIALIGVSRMYLGVHYMTDVIGGWLLGGMLFLALLALYDYFWPAKWRVSYDPPVWKDPLEKKEVWRHPSPTDLSPGEMVEFPKASQPWRHPESDPNIAPSPDGPAERKARRDEEYADSAEYIP